MAEFNFPDPLHLIVLFLGLGLVPFVAIMVTSFVKLVIVLSIVRNAIGVQQIPPNLVINGMALILSFYIMAPVLEDTFAIVSQENFENLSIEKIGSIAQKASRPIHSFLMKHSDMKERQFFINSARQIWPKEKAATLDAEDMIVLIPSFTVTELTSAFQIGFLIYLPFLVIDMIISNILLAMGMMMVSPMTISLPFKLLLFVLIDGWTRLIHGLILTYV